MSTRRAFGSGVGFAVGWADWLSNCAVIAYATVTIAEYVATLAPGLAPFQTAVALSVLTFFCAMHALGLRLSSSIQRVTSSVTALTFLVLAVTCLLHRSPAPAAAAAHSASPAHLLIPFVVAFRAIVVAYDGWYEAVYFTEEDTDAQKHLPRSMIGGVATVLVLFLLLNLAFLHVLQIPAMAASKLPAADAAQVVFHSAGGRFVTVLALITLLSLVNAVLLGAPRILFATGRDGLFTRRAAHVGPAGTPAVALLVSAVAAALLIVSGRFEDIIAIAAILVTALYSISFIAVITLRMREPNLPRPFRAWGYPLTTLIVLLGSLAFLAAAIHDDPVSAGRVLALLAIAAPAYFLMRRRQRSARGA